LVSFCQAADRHGSSGHQSDPRQRSRTDIRQGLHQRARQDTRPHVQDMLQQVPLQQTQYFLSSDPLWKEVFDAASAVNNDLKELDKNTALIEKTQAQIEAGQLAALREQQQQQLQRQEDLLKIADKSAGLYMKAEEKYYHTRYSFVYPELRSAVVGKIVSAKSDLSMLQAIMNAAALNQEGSVSRIQGLGGDTRAGDINPPGKEKKDGAQGTTGKPSKGDGESAAVTATLACESKRLDGRMPPPQRGTLSAAQFIAGRPLGDASMAAEQGKNAELLKQGEALLAKGRALGALNWARKMIEAYPNSADGHRLLAEALSRLRRHEEAEKAALESTRLDPDDPKGYIALAWARIHLKKNEEALEAINQALAIDPKDAKALVLRALIYERLGMRDKMLEDLRQAADLDPAFQEHLRRALAGERLFDPDDSDSYLLLEPLSRRRKPRAVPIGVGLAALGLVAGGFVSILRRRRRTAEAAPLDAAALEAQKRFAEKYRMTRRVGQTERSELWDAQDTTLGRDVQVRLLSFEAGGPGDKQRARALRDIHLLADVRHPGIESVVEVAEFGKGIQVVLEATPWATAEDILKTSGPMPFEKVRIVLGKVCDALSAAHKRGLLHRCVAPAKILVSDQGYVRLADFGSWGSCPLEYRAPETEGGAELPATDVYSLGATLYALLVGHPPYEADVCSRRAKREFKDPSLCVPGIPAAVDCLVRDALHPAPAVRIQSAQAFLERLSKA
jgi:tetratricopeptide (TPR) repeat protein